MSSMDLEQIQEQDNKRDQNAKQERDAKDTIDQAHQEVERAQRVALEWATEAVDFGKTAWQECKEGAIEDQRNTIEAEVCARFTNALGAEAARSLGQGVAKLTLNEPGGLQQTVAAAVSVSIHVAEDIGAVKGGAVPELLVERAVTEELARKMEKDEQTRRR